MGVDLFLRSFNEKKETVKTIKVERAAKVQKWLLEKAREGKSGSCWAENILKENDLEQLIAAHISGRFLQYTREDKDFLYGLNFEIGFNYPDIAEKLVSGKMTPEEIPAEIIENYIKKRNDFENREVQKVINFLKESFEKNLKVEVYANW